MREIKFRLWNGASMEPVGAITFHTDESYHVNDEYPVNDQTMEQAFGGIQYFLMAFSGLRDKHGQEIYDGDIVRCGERVGIGRLLKPVMGEVHYVGSCACFCIRIPDGDDGGTVSWEFGHYADKEVIGNIYENPDLLKIER
jgi:uncharacterized phage protein (TIGR01671 family)